MTRARRQIVAPSSTRSAGERLGQLCGIDVAVVRIPQAEPDAVGGDERMPRADLRRRQQLEPDALRTRLSGDVAKLVDPLRAVRKPDAAGHVVVDRVTRFLRQARIQQRGVALQPQDAPGGGEVRAVAGRVPGGACRQLVALEQHRIRPPEPR